jgi:peptidylprolyl isomerase
MKLPSAILVLLAASAPLVAQTSAPSATKPVHHTAAATAHTASGGGCITVPALSPKIPALPTGAPCAKALYTFTTMPPIRADYVSPLEGGALLEALGLESSTFSLGYIDSKVGTGELAAPHKWYTIQYSGYLVDGTKFDSSYDHPDHEPFVFMDGAHQVITGWDTGFAGMRVGGKRRLFIPYQLAYGPNGKPPIPGKAELIFDLEFISQSDQKPEPKPAPAPPPAATTPSVPGASANPAPAAAPAQPATPPATAAPKPQ